MKQVTHDRSSYDEKTFNSILNFFSKKSEKASLVRTKKAESTWIREVTHPSSILLASGVMAGSGAVIGAIFFGPIGALVGAAVFFLPVLIGMTMFRLGMKRKYSNYKPPKPTTNRAQHTEQFTSSHVNECLPTLKTKAREKNNNQTRSAYKMFNPLRSSKESPKDKNNPNVDSKAYKKINK